MENSEETRKDSKLFKFVGIPLILISVLLVGPIGLLQAFRNTDQTELAKRFVRNNDVIKQEIGEVSFFWEMLAKKQESNRWQVAGRVQGTKKTVAIRIDLGCNQGNSDTVHGCWISKARYQNANEYGVWTENGNWTEVEIGWFENTRLLFKPSAAEPRVRR